MEEAKKNLCAMIPASLHAIVREKQTESGKTMSEYIEAILKDYYDRSEKNMGTGTKTLAFQIPEELFERIKDYIRAESERTGKKLTQRDFIIGLIEERLNESH